MTGKWMYFIHKCLPFGASISVPLFQDFSNVLSHLIEFRIQQKKRVTNYLDDFLFIVKSVVLCNWMIQKFLDLCLELGVPISREKTEFASEIIVYLGILLDGRNLVLAIPEEK